MNDEKTPIEKALELLKGDAESWRKWRRDSGFPEIDLTDQAIEWGANADGKRFVLRGVRLKPAQLEGREGHVDLARAELCDGAFHDALRNADFGRTRFSNIEFADADLRGLNLRGSRFQDCNFSDAVLGKDDDDGPAPLEMRGVEARSCSFQKAKFFRVSLTQCRFRDCDLRGAEGVIFDRTFLQRTAISPYAKDLWSELRRRYTGANMIFILIFSALFFLPFAIEAAAWRAADDFNTRLDEIRIVTNPGGLNGSPPQASDDALPTSYPLIYVLLGWHRGPLAGISGLFLLLFNLSRLAMTIIVAPLREEEERSFQTPAFSPDPLPFEKTGSIIEWVKKNRKSVGAWMMRDRRRYYGWLATPNQILTGAGFIALLLGAWTHGPSLFTPITPSP